MQINITALGPVPTATNDPDFQNLKKAMEIELAKRISATNLSFHQEREELMEKYREITEQMHDLKIKMTLLEEDVRVLDEKRAEQVAFLKSDCKGAIEELRLFGIKRRDWLST